MIALRMKPSSKILLAAELLLKQKTMLEWEGSDEQPTWNMVSLGLGSWNLLSDYGKLDGTYPLG